MNENSPIIESNLPIGTDSIKTLEQIRILDVQPETTVTPADQEEFNRGMAIAQKIIRQQMLGRKRTKKNRGAQAGAFGTPKIKRGVK